MSYDPPPPYSATAPSQPLPSYAPTAQPPPPGIVLPPPPTGMYPTHPTAPQEMQLPYQGPVLQNPPCAQTYPVMDPLSSGPKPPVVSPCIDSQSHPYPRQQQGVAGSYNYAGTTPVVPASSNVVTVVMQGSLGPYSSQVTCPKCHATVMTSTKPECGLLTFLAAGLCIVFGCVFGCCLIPFCVHSMQDIQHFCPNCKQYIGVHRRL